MRLSWEKLKVNPGSSYQCRWVLEVNGVPAILVEKFKETAYDFHPYKVFDIRGAGSKMIRLFWKDADFVSGDIDEVGTLKNAKRYAESVVIGGK